MITAATPHPNSGGITTSSISYGQCVAASVYFVLESLLVRTQSDRLSLFLPVSLLAGGATSGGMYAAASANEATFNGASAAATGVASPPPSSQLCLVANVGVGTAIVAREQPVAPCSLVQRVFTSRVAANLSRAELDDVVDCRGPTNPRNSLVFPIRTVASRPNASAFTGAADAGAAADAAGASPPPPPFGVIQLVNKRRGAVPYSAKDELLLHCAAPTIAAILERYPTRLAQFAFDPAPLHRWSPLPSSQQRGPPMIDVAESLAAEPTQLVLRRAEGEGRLTRGQWRAASSAAAVVEAASDNQPSGVSLGGGVGGSAAVAVDTSEAASNVADAARQLRTMEECWRASVAENMRLERLVSQKEHHIHDAREIIARRQRKLDVMKDVLCDEIGRHLRGESALTKSAGGM